MNNRKGDWWCPTCQFTIWESKAKCLKCGYAKPDSFNEKKINMTVEKTISSYWKPGDNDPKWDRHGPYSILKGGYYGEALPDEPSNLKHPDCGCGHLEWCPKRHHRDNCRCYTCRYKTHKW